MRGSSNLKVNKTLMMVNDLINYYRNFENFKRYSPESKDRARKLKDFCNRFKKYFGKKVLDLCCGGGTLGFILEEMGIEYVGIDMNPDMIREAENYKRLTNSKCRFIQSDIFLVDLKGEKFDCIVCIGNSLAHLEVIKFPKLIEKYKSYLKTGGFFILEYRDVVKLLFEKRWKDVYVKYGNDSKYVSINDEIDTSSGVIWQVHISLKNFGEKGRFFHSIYSPFIVRAIMSSQGFSLVYSEEVLEWQGIREVYVKLK